MLIVIDTETTGLRPDDACIWDLAAVAVEGGAIVGEWESRVRPAVEHFQAEHRDVVRRVSGLSDRELLALLDERPLHLVRRELVAWLCARVGVPFPPSDEDWKTVGPRAPVIRATSYNVEFDRGFLGVMPWELCWHATAAAPIEWEWAPCVMRTVAEDLGARGIVPRTAHGYRAVKLPVACGQYGVRFEETHRALADARAAAELALRLGVS